MKFFSSIRRKLEPKSSYFPFIDGMRGVAILLVLQQHLTRFSFGFIGVDIFFVISGFIIFTKYFQQNEFNPRIFLFRRLSRLYPVLLLVLAINWIFPVLRENNSISDFLKSLFFLKNFGNWGSSLGPFWSISAEEQFYFISACILGLRFRRSFLFNMTIFYFFSVTLLGTIRGLAKDDFNTPYILYIVFSRPAEILIGCFIASKTETFVRFYLYLTPRIRHLIGILLILASVFLHSSIGVSLLTGALIIHYFAENNKLTFLKFLENKYLIMIGVLSYSIYVWHMSIIIYLNDFYINRLILKLIMLVTIFCISYLSYAYFEIPLQTYLRKNFKL